MKPESTFIFQPGGMGINFVKQWNQANMSSISKLYTIFTVDGVSLPALKENALGTLSTLSWGPDLKNDVNEKFVTDYKLKFKSYPSFYAAQAYDTILAIDFAVSKSNSKDIDKMREVLSNNKIPTTRGHITLNENHFPIQDFYLREAIKDNEGNFTSKIVKTVFKNHKDAYFRECKF